MQLFVLNFGWILWISDVKQIFFSSSLEDDRLVAETLSECILISIFCKRGNNYDSPLD